jgi:protein-L-isoaspartate(D-aspartate) O-methyltransferase
MNRTLPIFFFFLLTTACTSTPDRISFTPVPEETRLPPSAPAATQAPTVTTSAIDPYEILREQMVQHQIASRDIENPVVLEAMLQVPRHKFVPDIYLDQAYDDHPIPIGYGQTISQPYIVGLMSEALLVEPGMRVLEIGTGSGYQAAVLAEMGMEVFTIEIIPELAEEGRVRLETLGYSSVSIQNADGYFGWEEYAPFDAIIVTAAPDHLPQPLINQLAEGGHLVIPIGPIGSVQTLWLFEKIGGEISALNLGAVRFVPFTRAENE